MSSDPLGRTEPDLPFVTRDEIYLTRNDPVDLGSDRNRDQIEVELGDRAVRPGCVPGPCERRLAGPVAATLGRVGNLVSLRRRGHPAQHVYLWHVRPEFRALVTEVERDVEIGRIGEGTVERSVDISGYDRAASSQVRLNQPRRDRLLHQRSRIDACRCLVGVPHTLPCNQTLMRFYETLTSQVAPSTFAVDAASAPEY